MAKATPNSPRRPRRTWLIPAIVASIALLGGVTGNLVATYLGPILEPYRPVV